MSCKKKNVLDIWQFTCYAVDNPVLIPMCLHSYYTESRTLWMNMRFYFLLCRLLCLSQGARSNFSTHNRWQSPVSRMAQKQHEGLTFSLIKMLMKLSKQLLKSQVLPFGLYVWIVSVTQRVIFIIWHQKSTVFMM